MSDQQRTWGAILFRDFLLSRKISHRSAAAALGVSPSTIGNWTTGASVPDATDANFIARWTLGAVPVTSWVPPNRLRAFKALKPCTVAA